VNDEGRRLLDESLHHRAERLLKLITLTHGALPRLVCTEVKLVLKAAFARYPEEMGSVLSEWLAEQCRADVGLCADCTGPLDRQNENICPACEARQIQEAEDFQI
jgi:hypothetical protein